MVETLERTRLRDEAILGFEARLQEVNVQARAAKAVLDYDRRCQEVNGFLAGAEAHGARWDALRVEAARRGDNVSIIDLPGYAPLTEAERALHATGEAILADGAGPHLTRVQNGAALATAALARLESHALLDRCVAAMNGLGEAGGWRVGKPFRRFAAQGVGRCGGACEGARAGG